MPVRLLLASSLVSVFLLGGLAFAYFLSGSKLALAQAADSLSDAITGFGLVWALHVSLRPPDKRHAYGHQGAQPIAALVVAMIVGALAVQVFVDAVRTLIQGTDATLTWSVAAALGVKTAIKAVFVKLASRRDVLAANAAVRAFKVDARSDMIVGLASLVGFFAARFGGMPTLDAWLALPIALWIGVSGLGLARESINLLMGAAPEREWSEALLREVASMPGVRAVAGVKAHAFGDGIHAWVEIRVDASLTVAQAHDIGEAVEARLLEHREISDAFVHVDAAVGP